MRPPAWRRFGAPLAKRSAPQDPFDFKLKRTALPARCMPLAAGIHATTNESAESAVAHAAARHKHFIAVMMRWQPQPQLAQPGGSSADTEAAAAAASAAGPSGAGPGVSQVGVHVATGQMPLPQLYAVSGGSVSDFWVYGARCA